MHTSGNRDAMQGLMPQIHHFLCFIVHAPFNIFCLKNALLCTTIVCCFFILTFPLTQENIVDLNQELILLLLL